jgi:hypothetical protein
VEKLLARLERRLGRYASQGIILWMVGISGALHLLVFARPEALQLLWLTRTPCWTASLAGAHVPVRAQGQ